MPSDHNVWCAEARQLYLETLVPEEGRLDWNAALTEAREAISNALRASDYLRDVSGALQSSGKHSLVFRHLLAPPKSQDQFKLICHEWPKSTEKSGNRVAAARAVRVAAAIELWRERRLTPWLDARRNPYAAELDSLLLATSHLIAQQGVATARRNRLAKVQEEAVVALLEGRGWERVPSRLIDERAQLGRRQFMHKTRFASGPNEHQEVDIACGLGGTRILAMECKVTNDETNSVKRVNDVLKKASAWREQWGRYLKTAALLQGVLKPADVQRLVDSDVQVFWSHRLPDFEEWLETQLTDD